MTKVNCKRDSKIFQLLWYVDPGLSKNMWTWLLKSGCIYSITLHGDLSSTKPLFLCFFVPILSNTSHHNHHRNKRLSQYIKVEKYFFLHNNTRISHSFHTEEIISLCNVLPKRWSLNSHSLVFRTWCDRLSCERIQKGFWLGLF